MRSSRSRRAKRYLPPKPGRRFLRETPVAAPDRPEGGARWKWEVPILIVGLILSVVSGVIAYRLGGPYGERFETNPNVTRIVDSQTGALESMHYDTTGDMKFDTWGYFVDGKQVRMERDTDGDGRVDHWRYYRADETRSITESDTDGDGEPDERRLYDRDGTRTATLDIRQPINQGETR